MATFVKLTRDNIDETVFVNIDHVREIIDHGKYTTLRFDAAPGSTITVREKPATIVEMARAGDMLPTQKK